MDNENLLIRLLICDDQPIVREGLRAVLIKTPEIVVVGEAQNGAEVIALIPSIQPDIVLMDLKMPVLDGVKATKIIRERYPKVRVLVLTTYDADEWVMDAIRNGAAGYLLKDTPREDLVRAIIDTMRGRNHIDSQVAGKLMTAFANQPASPVMDAQLFALSDREREVFQLLGRGLNNSEIAQKLFITEGTVKNYVSTILSKLGVADRTQAALLAVRTGIRD
jgi:DNA-binding NarL/FixJ family response regulator